MFEQYVGKIIQWNRKRGLLTKFDPSLSLRLLSEEAKEFYMAETLAEALCEYADFWFVYHGYRASSACCQLTAIGFADHVSGIKAIEEWVLHLDEHMRKQIEFMYSQTRYPHKLCSLDPKTIDMDKNHAMECVIYCNEMKSSKKDSSGKIVKAEHQEKPAPMVEQRLLKRYGA